MRDFSTYKDPIDLRSVSLDRLQFEGDRRGHQFNQWNDLFNLESAIRRHELCELYKWCIFSNRYILIERENQSAYKLFTKQEVIEMVKEAYNQGWQDGRYSEEENLSQSQGEQNYLSKLETL